jgi:hypothetical protein
MVIEVELEAPGLSVFQVVTKSSLGAAIAGLVNTITQATIAAKPANMATGLPISITLLFIFNNIFVLFITFYTNTILIYSTSTFGV